MTETTLLTRLRLELSELPDDVRSEKVWKIMELFTEYLLEMDRRVARVVEVGA